MAIISPIAADTDLNAASGFYRAEASNVAAIANAVAIGLAQGTLTPVTFANAGTLQKVIAHVYTTTVNAYTDYPTNVNCSLVQVVGTCTISNANPTVITKSGHGFTGGEEVMFTTTGAIPTGLLMMRRVWVNYIDANTFYICPSLADALAGTNRIGTSSAGSGTHTLWKKIETVSLTNAQMMDSLTNVANVTSGQGGSWLRSFSGFTTAVNTTSNLWGLFFDTSAAVTSSFNVGLSGTSATRNTNIYAAFCNNAVSFSNGDMPVCDLPVRITASCTLATTCSGWVLPCSGDLTDTANLYIDPSQTAITVTIPGWLKIASHGTIRAGKRQTFTGVLAIGATSATLSSAWTGVSGVYPIYTSPTTDNFPEWKRATFTNGSTSVTWTGGLTKSAGVTVFVGISRDYPLNIVLNNAASKIDAFQASNDWKQSFAFYGDRPDVMVTKLTSAAVTGQAHIITDDALAAGQIVYVGGKDIKDAGENSVYTVQSVAGTDATLTGNLAGQNRVAEGLVFVTNGFGIDISSTTGAVLTSMQNCTASNFRMVGVSAYNAVLTLTGGVSLELLANHAPFLEAYRFSRISGTTPNRGLVSSFPAEGLDIHKHYSVNCFASPTTSGSFQGITGVRIEDLRLTCVSAFTTILNFDISKVVTLKTLYIENCKPITINSFPLVLTASDLHYYGIASAAGTTAPLFVSSGGAYSQYFTDVWVDNCSVAQELDYSQVTHYTNVHYGTRQANTKDVYLSSSFSPYLDITHTNPTNWLIDSLATFRGVTAGSILRLYYPATNDYTHYLTTGDISNEKTIFKNSTTSLKVLTATAKSTIYTQTFSAASGITYHLKGNVRHNADYIAAGYTLPSVTVTGGGMATASFTAIADADAWQVFDLTILQTSGSTATMTITFTVQSATATGACYLDGVISSPFVTASRFYGYDIDDAALIKTVDPIIVKTEAQALAVTGVAVDFGTSTITVSGTVDIRDFYDYCKAILCQPANLTQPNFISSTDGVNFYCSFNMHVTSTGHLTGNGVENIGVNTVTLDAGGSSTVNIVSTTQTLTAINITGLVAGSRVQIYDTTASSEIYNDIVAGTSLFLNQFWTVDHTLRIRVKFTDATTSYEEYQATGTFAQTGFSTIVSQALDTVYATNNVDGSTVTECSISGSTIRIYIDDPDNGTSFQRIYNWYQYILFTSVGIADQSSSYFYAISPVEYRFDPSMKLVNQDVTNALTINGANIAPTSGTASIIDNSNGASIVIYSYFPVDASGNLGNLDIKVSDVRKAIYPLY